MSASLSRLQRQRHIFTHTARDASTERLHDRTCIVTYVSRTIGVIYPKPTIWVGALRKWTFVLVCMLVAFALFMHIRVLFDSSILSFSYTSSIILPCCSIHKYCPAKPSGFKHWSKRRIRSRCTIPICSAQSNSLLSLMSRIRHIAVMLFTCPLQSDVLSRDTPCRGISHLICVCSRSSIPSVSPAAEPSENRTSNLTFAVMLFTCTLQSDVLSRDTTCRGIGHVVCACSRVPSPLSHRLQSQAKTTLRTSHLQSCCSLAHYSQTFLAVTPPAEASVTLSVPLHQFHPLSLTGCRAKRKPHFEPHICSHVIHLPTTVRRS